MLHLRPNVVVDGLKEEMYFALGMADQVYAHEGLECVVTAALDGVHNPGSLHPQGYAIDLHNADFAMVQHVRVLATLKRLEKYGFDVIDEKAGASAATTGSHFHIEFQPKPGGTFWHRQ